MLRVIESFSCKINFSNGSDVTMVIIMHFDSFD